ncbi:MAG: 5'/3'-nucleotidase SurE [Pseudomonadota bacterium]
MPLNRVSKISKKRQAPLILVSNDDGVRSMGIRKLMRKLAELGRVVVVAPDQQRSAVSHSITLHRPLRVERISHNVYSVDGTPTDCIMLAINEILKQVPDLIVSGINHGANLGDDVHYSGTVSAAFEGGILGIPSMAVSLVGSGQKNFVKAAEVAAIIARDVLRKGLPRGIILNINVPDTCSHKIKGMMFTKQGKRNYGGIIVEKKDPRGRKYYWIGGDESGFEDIPGSDCNAIKEGFVSITPLRVNLTDKATLKKLSDWHKKLSTASKASNASKV